MPRREGFLQNLEVEVESKAVGRCCADRRAPGQNAANQQLPIPGGEAFTGPGTGLGFWEEGPPPCAAGPRDRSKSPTPSQALEITLETLVMHPDRQSFL